MGSYQLPADYYFKLAIALVLKKRRSLQRDSRCVLQNLTPPLELRGAEHIPAGGRYLVTVNHYTAQGHNVLWSALAISAVIPAEVHWVMTNAWTFPGKPLRNLLRRGSELFFARLAAIYDIFLTPPMPPDPREQVARALSIRHLLAFAHRESEAVIGFAPEGRDFPGNRLGWPPSGAGRLMLELSHLGYRILPAGVCKENEVLVLRFGPSFELSVMDERSKEEQDRLASQQVMTHIAALLPTDLRGDFEQDIPRA
ncbi:MAG TPA: 1-acyl-sn-glycerol-3-phosphate acyltransferase [Longilinea sp.]|nr:1-acyl-sn-glycerol-3-phosphate acyltransferase [Longilinea sp.]